MDFPLEFLLVIGFVLGIVIGSFLTCVVWRVPRRIPITGRSICPSCKTQLKDQYNVPVFGWLFLKGKSACCNTPISIRYPLLELLSGVVGMLIAALLGAIALFVVVVLVIVVSALVSWLTADKTKAVG